MLYAPLKEALLAAGDALSLIVVGTGPGSYTGVRISIAAAHGVALSRSVPIIGCPSIAALSGEERYRVVGDARRGKLYTAEVSKGHLISPLVLVESLPPSALPTFTSDENSHGADIQRSHPDAILLARKAMALGEEAVWTLAQEHHLEPLYVQEAFITKAKQRA
jgi:tRNA A37 threonylcarbamoyladenosine modification protein TsaB